MHRILERQIKRFLGTANTIPPAWVPLLDAISDTYAHLDDDRALLERSLELSSKEFLENTQRLQETKDKIEETVQERTRELEYEKTKLNSVAQNMTSGAFLLNGEGEVVFINRKAREMIGGGGSDEETVVVLSRKFASLNIAQRINKCFDVKESYSVPEIDVDGRVYEVLFQCIDTVNEVKQYSGGLLILIRDITAEKILERSKSEFISIASHEMRTPLAIIRGNAELMKDLLDTLPLPREDIEKMRTSIHGSAIRLLDIVNDFLDVSRIEGKQVQFNKDVFDIIAPIQEVVTDFQKTVGDKGISLAFEVPTIPLPPIVADHSRAEQVITNLIGNAIHYTEHGGVRVDVRFEGGFVKMFVSDTGIGIAPENQGLLFQKFKTVGEAFRHSKEYGSGLGLYIGKMLMESMGGKIALEKSTLGEGSVFSASFPVVPQSPPQDH